MVKVLIASDSDIISNGISRALTWNEYSFEIVFVAKNSVDTLNFLDDNHVDIILSDIKTQNINGIELQEDVHKKYPKLPFIFMSEYNNSVHIKTALDNGAFSCIQKPFSASELLSELQRLAKAFNMQVNKNSLQKIIEENLFVFNSKWRFEGFEQFKKEYESSYFCVINFRCLKGDVQTPINILAFENKIHQIISKKFPQNNFSKIEVFSRGVTYCVMDKYKDTLNYSIQEFLATLNKTLQNTHTMPFGVWTGGIYKGIDKLCDSYVEAFGINAFKLVLKNDTLQDSSTMFDAFSILFNAEDIIIASLLCGNFESAAEILKQQHTFIEENKMTHDDILLFLKHLLLKYIKATLDENPNIIVPENLLINSLFDGLSIPQLFETTDEQLKKIYTLTKPLKVLSPEFIISQAKDYVNNNFKDPYLSIISVSAHVELNTSFFSNEFTKYEKMTLSQYILNVRMESAKYLLKNTRASITQVSNKVGYINASYFSTVFEKAFGLTPSVYRKTATSNS